VNEFFLLTGVVLGEYRYQGNVTTLILGFAAMGIYFLQVTLFYLTKNFDRDFQKGETGELRSWMLFAIFLAGILNRLTVGIHVFFFLGVGVVLAQMINFFLKRKS